MNSNSSKEPEHISVLDGIRGLAIITVLIHHSLLLPTIVTKADKWIEAASRPLWIGVDLFFVLSGFLITGILSRTYNHPHYFRNFYARRSLRIFPLYYGSLFLFLIVFPLLTWHGFNDYRTIQPAEKTAFWLYYINYFHQTTWPVGNLGHYWSLCVEEHFYLVWPLTLWIFRGRILIPAVAGIAATTIFRLIAINAGWWTTELGYHSSHLRMDSILTGALAFWLQNRYKQHPRFMPTLQILILPMALATLAVLLFAKVRSSPTGNLIGFPVINLTMATFLLFVLNSKPENLLKKALGSRFLLLAGKYSYSLYIFHFPVLHLAYQATGSGARPGEAFWPQAIAPNLIMFAGTAVLSWLSWHLVERRALSLKKYFSYQLPKQP